MRDNQRPFDDVLGRATEALRDRPIPDGPPAEVVARVAAVGKDLNINMKPRFGERILKMKRLIKIAAMVLILIGIAVVMNFWPGGGGSIAFADVIQPIMNARTVMYKILMGTGDNATVIEDMVLDRRIRRTVPGIEGISIIDLDSQTILELNPETKRAVFWDMKGLPQKMPSPIESLRNLITMLEDSPHFAVKELDKQILDGRNAIGFHAQLYGSESNVALTIWADPETAVPIRIEMKEGQVNYIIADFQFDVDLDESLFSMEVPEGYTEQQAELDLLGSTEEDFIEGLRILVKTFENGVFPDSIAIEDYVKKAPQMIEQCKVMGLTHEQELELETKMSKYLMFIRFFNAKNQGEWHWAGAGVTLGDADKAIFWYQPKDSKTWRVIYGDLTVEDVAPEDLPEPLEEQPAEAPAGYQSWSKDEFIGSQKDEWHITAGDMIEAHSFLDLRKGPEEAQVLTIELPYSVGRLVSVRQGEELIYFSHVRDGEYHIEISWQRLEQGDRAIECVWTMPLETIMKSKDTCEIEMRSLIPVVSYHLTAKLAEGCGWLFPNKPDEQSEFLFSKDNSEPKQEFGVCGMPIERIQP